MKVMVLVDPTRMSAAEVVQVHVVVVHVVMVTLEVVMAVVVWVAAVQRAFVTGLRVRLL